MPQHWGECVCVCVPIRKGQGQVGCQGWVEKGVRGRQTAPSNPLSVMSVNRELSCASPFPQNLNVITTVP